MKIISIVFGFLMPLFAMAQTEGTIVYSQTVQFNFEAPEGMEDMFKNMPKSRSSDKVLYFKKKESLFKNIDSKDFNAESRIEDADNETVVQIKMVEPDNQVYSDFGAGNIVAKEELMGKPFIINDKLKKYDWKVTSERRKILEYQCMKATAQEDSSSIVAWFTTTIPIRMGPSKYNGLPGAILMIEVNDGERQIIAKNVSLESIEPSLIEKPAKGKKVNRKQFDKIKEEKLAEMKAVHGGTGVRVIMEEH